jgi:hypothetical protein
MFDKPDSNAALLLLFFTARHTQPVSLFLKTCYNERYLEFFHGYYMKLMYGKEVPHFQPGEENGRYLY